MDEKRSYWYRVKQHPGTPIASILTAAGFVAGVDGGLVRGLIGAAIMAVCCWVPVLLTAREPK